LTGRQILLRFHERSTAPHVAQSHAHPRPARHVRRRQRLRARWQPTEPLGRCVVSRPRMRFSAKYVPNKGASERGFPVCLIPSLSGLYYALGNQRRGVTTRVGRLEQTLNKPKVVLVVGVLAVALNVLLYFGLFLPRMTPLIAHINPIGTSLPEAISTSDPEAGSNSHPEDSSTSDSKSSNNSYPEVNNTSDSESSSVSGPGARGKSVSEESLASETDSSPDSPSGSPPELPPLPTPTEGQYE
jgi:hypothetical protein